MNKEIAIPCKNKRGRPRKMNTGPDKGTPELQQKRSIGATAELLDYCLHQGLISQREHSCGVRIRWLYSLRYGVPHVKCLNIQVVDSAIIEVRDPKWQKEREEEFIAAITILKQKDVAQLILSICVYNELPKKEYKNWRELLRIGLSELASHWKLS